MEIERMPPYGYLRKSRVVDLATSFGPETQEREIRALAARFGDNGSNLVFKADWDISGDAKHTSKRTGYLELVAAIESGECSALYSYSLSRLGRSVQALNELFRLCNQRAIPIRLVADSVDTSTASGRLTSNILASLAEFESEVAGERRRAQIQSKRARGESLRTRRWYGEGPGEDADLVLRIYRETGSYSRTAKRLNHAGIKARSGKAWYATSVRLVVQRMDPTIRSQGRGASLRKVTFRFARLLRCPTCKTLLTGSTSKGQPRYVCSNYADTPHAKVSVGERLVRPWIEAEAARLRLPEKIEMDVESRERAQLAARRLVIEDMYETNGPSWRDEYRRRLAALVEAEDRLDDAERAASIVTVPAVDWDWPPERLNTVLRALWSEVVLDETMMPIKAEWRLPAEYVA